MLLFFKNVQLRKLSMKQRQTHAGSLQINFEIFITCSTTRVYVNRKTRIKRAKNRMQLRLKKNVRVKKSHVRVRL